MPPPPLFIMPGFVPRRPGNRIAGTNFVNQLRDVVYATMPIATTGNADRFLAARDAFFCKTTANSRDGSNWRWTYTIQEVTKSSTGFTGWATIGSALTPSAYNFIEAANGASGVMGNGVDTANLETGFEIKPVPNGTLLRAYAVIANGTTTEYWFSYENGVDGSCA